MLGFLIMIRRFSIFLFLVVPYLAKAQGCSDAGICSMPQSSVTSHEKSIPLSLSVEQTWELGEQDMQYLHSVFGLALKASDKLDISFSIPLRNAYYSQEWYAYISDATLASRYLVSDKIGITLGAKFPIGTVTAQDAAGNHLPMALQGGLGTYDLLFQGEYKMPSWSVALGYQLPFGAIDNTFEPNGKFIDFQNSYHLDRGDDIMLRYNRMWASTNLNWMASVVSVYRIKGDYIYDGERVPESEGISFNLGLQAIKAIQKGNLKARLAVPVYVRKARPDGLTRTVIIALAWEGFL